MKNNKYFPVTTLAVVMGIALLTMTLVRTFAPTAVLPKLDIPNMVLVSVAALLLEHYLTGGSKGGYLGIFLMSALAFGLLPLATFFAQPLEALKLAGVDLTKMDAFNSCMASFKNALEQFEALD